METAAADLRPKSSRFGASPVSTAEPDAKSAPSSPYSGVRRTVHSLTLPPIPDVSIPQSPRDSPDVTVTSKVQRFLDLKAQGTHFNQGLASNSALLNPGALPALMEFAGIDEEASRASSLPDDLQVGGVAGSSLEGWAYADGLDAEIKARQRNRQQERKNVEFVQSKHAA